VDGSQSIVNLKCNIYESQTFPNVSLPQDYRYIQPCLAQGK
jgi:hypothetical protein